MPASSALGAAACVGGRQSGRQQASQCTYSLLMVCPAWCPSTLPQPLRSQPKLRESRSVLGSRGAPVLPRCSDVLQLPSGLHSPSLSFSVYASCLPANAHVLAPSLCPTAPQLPMDVMRHFNRSASQSRAIQVSGQSTWEKHSMGNSTARNCAQATRSPPRQERPNAAASGWELLRHARCAAGRRCAAAWRVWPALLQTTCAWRGVLRPALASLAGLLCWGWAAP